MRTRLGRFPLIWAHAALRDYEEAFGRLEKAYREHRDGMLCKGRPATRSAAGPIRVFMPSCAE
jgi:hypothetical protein